MFLGTSGSAPTAQRATSATLVRRGGDKLLIDCGEGTQRQLLRSDVGLADLEDVFLTHFHADHYLGLPGMLKTLRPARPRGAADASTARPGCAICSPSCGASSAASPTRSRRSSSSRATRSTAATTRSARSRSTTAPQAIGYLIAEADRPGRFDVDGRRRARRSAREGARAAAAWGGRRARERGDGHARAGARPRPPEPLARPHRRHGAGRVGRRGSHRRRPARPRGDVRRRRAAARPRDEPLDRRRGGARRARRRASGCSR